MHAVLRWQSRTTHRRCRRAGDAVEAICGEQSASMALPHRCRRACAGSGRHCDIQKPFPPGRLRDGLNAHCARIRSACLQRIRACDSKRGLRDQASLSLSASPTTAPISRRYRRSWRVARHLDTTRCMSLRSGCWANTISRRFATPNARRSRRRNARSLDVIRDGDAVDIVTRRARTCTARCARCGLIGLGRRRPLERG